jgi:hypothetical protein
MRGTYEEWHWDGLRWHDIRTKFHDDWFRHSSNVKLITSVVWEAALLVLLMGRIYEVRFEMASCDMLCVPSFMWSVQAVQWYKFIVSTIWEAAVLVLVVFQHTQSSIHRLLYSLKKIKVLGWVTSHAYTISFTAWWMIKLWTLKAFLSWPNRW